MNIKWWKLLSIIILTYSFVGGLLVPLKPGIVNVSPISTKTGKTLTLKVEGYNSQYTIAKNIRAWLKFDNTQALAANTVNVLRGDELKLTFIIPEYLPFEDRVKDCALVLDNEIDGPSVLPSAVFVTQDSIDPDLAKQTWAASSIQGLHTKNTFTFPFRNILFETIRNTYFHVPLWFAMLFTLAASVFFSGKYLHKPTIENDMKAAALTSVGLLFGIMGLVTGAIWARWTWGDYWSFDIKQITTAIALLIYMAYFVLRNSFEDNEKKARLSAVYNIFAFSTLIPLLYVIPRLTDSLHPGSGGNPAFGSDDLDNTMRMIFYPAIIGWTLMGFWLAQLSFRSSKIKNWKLDN